MSSFTICKKEYIKAAGFLAACTELHDRHREPLLRLWHNREGRLYTAEDVRKDFVRCFETNAAAVAKQYGDPTPETDPNAYDAEFHAYRHEALLLMKKGCLYGDIPAQQEGQRVVYCLISFFSSVLYQIEDEDNHRRALRIMNKYYRGLYRILQKLDSVQDEDCTCWGRFDALDEEPEED